jgi:phosphoribosylformimino-5-aminoimidazole carboxamide ribotide isomerase
VRLYPAIDILGGNAVRLVQGDFDAKKVYDQDPLSAAKGWVDAGAEHLHIVDLDGARLGKPVNLAHLEQIAGAVGVPVQYGGGLRSADAVRDALAAGAARVILGTVAMDDPPLLRQCLEEHGPERIMVGVDVRGGHVMTHGWLMNSSVQARTAVKAFRERGVEHLVFTNIDHDGMLDGANREEVEWVGKAAQGGSVIVSGGIGTLQDLKELAELALDALDGVIVGTALYERRFTVAEAKQALTLP